MDSRIETYKHKQRVQYYLGLLIAELQRRALVHDDSKLDSPEVEAFNTVGEKLAGLTYGSPEYQRCCREALGDALKHHYAKNDHHPEHFPNGVDGMNLAALCEMMCDWVAATERQHDGNIRVSIEKNQDRFHLAPQMKNVLLNTVPLLERKD